MSIRQSIVQQFKQPNGLFGKLAGHVMANRPSNIERNRWMLELARIQPQDRVLEIGYGPGLALEGALQTVDSGIVVGMDHSEVMYTQASNRVARAISQGRVRLSVGDIEAKPTFDTSFNHIYSANVVMFWQDPVAVFQHLKTLLVANGDIVTLYMPRHKGARSEDSYEKADEITICLKQAGLIDIRTEVKEFDGLAAIGVIAANA